MGKKSNPYVKKNFSFYQAIMKVTKKLLRSNFVFTKDANNKNFKATDEVLAKAKEFPDSYFWVEQKKHKPSYFLLKLRTDKLSKRPYVHFDSDGLDHMDFDAELKRVKIPTPHINYFDENGRNRARQTPELKKNPQKYRKLENAMPIFCEEVCVALPEETVATFIDKSSQEIFKKKCNFEGLEDF